MKTMLVVILAGFVLVSNVNAQNIFCANSKTGVLRVLLNGETSCKPKEIQVNVGGTPGPKGDIGPMGLTGPAGYTGPSAIDGTGQNIGVFVGLSDNGVLVYNTTAQAFVKLYGNSTTQEVGMHDVSVYSESTDCSGPKYFDKTLTSDPLFNQSIYLGNDGVHYTPAGEIQKLKVSSLGGSKNCVNYCSRMDIQCFPSDPTNCLKFGPAITWAPCNQEYFGPNSSDFQILAEERDLILAQEVALPFTMPITLPLSFQ